MAESTNGHVQHPGQSRTLSIPSGDHTHPKRAHKQHKHASQPRAQVDGTVSDSTMYPVQSPQSKANVRQRHQSVANGTPHKPNALAGIINGDKPRTASLGANAHASTPVKEQAYAGPTFQASPAPSSLPVPKFFSRSVPNVAAPSLAERIQGDVSSKVDQSSPESDVVAPEPVDRSGQMSPLDMFFKADQKEKERSRSLGMLSPDAAKRNSLPATEPRQMQQSRRSALFRELDGEMDDPPSPRTVPNKKHTTAQQRPTSSPIVVGGGGNDESDREAQTRALKDLLFNSVNATQGQSPTTSPSRPRDSALAPASQAVRETPSPFQRSTSGPSTPLPVTEQQQDYYSLHYGNRNLSPLFKAARNEPTPRPSGLRRQESASDASASPLPTNGHSACEIDPNSFSRSYIDQQVRTSGSTAMPSLAFSKDQSLAPIRSTNTAPSAPLAPRNVNEPVSGSQSGALPRTTSNGPNGSTSDVSRMENDLRKMLNLNVLSN